MKMDVAVESRAHRIDDGIAKPSPRARSHAKTAPAECSHYPGRDGGLAGAAMSSRNRDARNHHRGPLPVSRDLLRNSVHIAEESGPQLKSPRTPRCESKNGTTRGDNLRDQVAFRTICFRPKHSAQFTRGRSPDSQVVASPAGLPIPKNSGLLRRPLAAYSGGTVRDFHPLPFSLASH